MFLISELKLRVAERRKEEEGEGSLLKLIKRFALNLFRGLTPPDKENHNNTLLVLRAEKAVKQGANICN